MATLLNSNLFGNVLHRKQANQRWISDLHIFYDGALCDNIISEGNYVLTKYFKNISQVEVSSPVDKKGSLFYSGLCITIGYNTPIQKY